MGELPKRLPTDGAINVRRSDPDHMTMSVVTNEITYGARMSEYNAARLLCVLCVMLEVPVPKALGKLSM